MKSSRHGYEEQSEKVEIDMLCYDNLGHCWGFVDIGAWIVEIVEGSMGPQGTIQPPPKSCHTFSMLKIGLRLGKR